MNAQLEELIESLKQKRDQKKGVICSPLPIGSHLKKKPKEMQFGRQVTVKSRDTKDEQDSLGNPEMGIQRQTTPIGTQRYQVNPLIELNADLIPVSQISSTETTQSSNKPATNLKAVAKEETFTEVSKVDLASKINNKQIQNKHLIVSSVVNEKGKPEDDSHLNKEIEDTMDKV